MPFWRQNAEQVQPRNGTAPVKNAYPRSAPIYEPAMIPLGMENPGSTLPSDGFSARPSYIAVDVSFGDHDALGGRLMAVGQADLYDESRNPWPACGVWDQPGAAIAASAIVRLQPSTSAHPGLAQATGAGPAMVFQAPPVFTIQTRPIFALGV